jgi:putative membrane protein
MRRGCLTAAVLLLCLAWSPWARELATRYFSAHMAVHMTVVTIAAPLLAFAVKDARLGRRFGALWIAPIPAAMLELIVVWGWHVPELHHAARHDVTYFALEQMSFLLSGLLLWTSVFRATTAGILALLLTLGHMTLLGAILSLSPRPLFHVTGSYALFDQQIGGSLMLAISAVVYTAGGLWLGYVALRREKWVRS